MTGGSTDLSRRFGRLAAVNVLSNLMVPMAGLFDTAFLGHLTEIKHLAGVGLAAVLFEYLYWGFGFLRMGTTGLTAQAHGRGETEEARRILWRGALLGLGCGSLILLLQVPLREIGFWALSGGEAVEAAGRAYFQGRIWDAPVTLFNFAVVGWYLGRERSDRVLLIAILINVLNVGLDYWMIVRLGWGSYGAGFSTALAQYAQALLGLALLARDGQLRLPEGGWPALRAGLPALFRLNRDITIRTLGLISVFALFANIGATFGPTILAANTILMRVIGVAAYVIDGLAFATESLVGVFSGARSDTEMWRVFRFATAWGIAIGLLFAGAFIAFPERLFGLLTDHRDALEVVGDHRWWLLPVLCFGAVAYILDGYFIGLTAGAVLRWSMTTAAVLGFAPIALIAAQRDSNHGLWLAFLVFTILRVVTLGSRVPASLRPPA